MKNPSIPMSPDQLPQQRIVPVASIPARPNPFDAVIGWNEKPDGVVLANGPRNPEYLGQVEWAWSRMNNRVDAYYISRGRSHWMLWLYSYDDNWGKWDWLPIGYVPRKEAAKMSEKQCSKLWRHGKNVRSLSLSKSGLMAQWPSNLAVR